MRIRWNKDVTDYFTISNVVKQGGSLYLDQLVSRLGHIGMGRHMNGLFTGVFSTRTHDILFNASKTKYIIFKPREIVNVALLYFRGSHINCVHECDLLGITLSSNRTTDNVIEKEVMQFNIKSNVASQILNYYHVT